MFTLFLQAFLRGDTEVLKDWCHEAVSSLFMYHVLLLAVLKLGGVVLISLASLPSFPVSHVSPPQCTSPSFSYLDGMSPSFATSHSASS